MITYYAPETMESPTGYRVVAASVESGTLYVAVAGEPTFEEIGATMIHLRRVEPFGIEAKPFGMHGSGSSAGHVVLGRWRISEVPSSFAIEVTTEDSTLLRASLTSLTGLEGRP